mmetsp:Transcript_94964/g.257743  ORF Transcript_94964/g.257743 Transcript_94964/m.257743 type:complete len:245 (-) Transcript_94964:55-789(-)
MKSCAETLSASELASCMSASKETSTPAEPERASVLAAEERRRPSRATPVISTISGVAAGTTAATPDASAALTAGSPSPKARARSAGSHRAREKLPVRRATAAGLVVVVHVAVVVAVVMAKQLLGHLSIASGMPQSTMPQYHSSVHEVLVLVMVDTVRLDKPVELAIDVAVLAAAVLMVVTELVIDLMAVVLAVVLSVVTVDIVVPVGVPLVPVPVVAETVEVVAVVVAQKQGHSSNVSCKEQSR